MNLHSLLSELRRRRVFRVAAVYAVVAWLLIQIAETTFPYLSLPAWTVTLVIVLTLLGFAIALVLAWAFDITPEGVVRTERREDEAAAAEQRPLAAAPSGMKRPVRPGQMVVVGAVVILALAGAAFGMWGWDTEAELELERSIAVLPFANLSAEAENEYFAAGIHDEILTQLSKIGELKVISRASVLPFRDGERNLRDIAAQLGVATVLEGSVQRTGNRVRITAQLIDARTDRHLWAERYDRELSDVFAIQTAVALEIAAALRANLSAGERAVLEQRPTANTEAYDFYLRGLEYLNRPEWERRNLEHAERLFRQATELDPHFAHAHAQLSHVHSAMYWFAHDLTDARRTAAKEAADRALSLEPMLPEAHSALGHYYYWGYRDYDRALQSLEVARRLVPNSADFPHTIGAISRRQGRWDQAVASFERAVELDPRNLQLLDSAAETYLWLRRYPEALRLYDRILSLAPDFHRVRLSRAYMHVDWRGDMQPLREAVAQIPSEYDEHGALTRARFSLALWDRDHAQAIQVLAAFPREVFDTPVWLYAPKSKSSGLVHWARGDGIRARAAYDSARVILERAIAAEPRNEQLQVQLHSMLGEVYAGLGRREDAMREGRRALEIIPVSRDAGWGSVLTRRLAHIHAMLGEADLAIPQIEWLLSAPAGISVHDLRLNPRWAPIRGDPRFQRLLLR